MCCTHINAAPAGAWRWFLAGGFAGSREYLIFH
jgi:hypothetical protein